MIVDIIVIALVTYTAHRLSVWIFGRDDRPTYRFYRRDLVGETETHHSNGKKTVRRHYRVREED